MTIEEQKTMSKDLMTKKIFNLSEANFERFVERMGICTESSVPEDEAFEIAIAEVTK